MSVRTTLTVEEQGLPVREDSTPAHDSRAQPEAPQPSGAGHTTTRSERDKTNGDTNSSPRASEKGISSLEVVGLESTGFLEEDRPYSVFNRTEKWLIVVAIAFAGLLG